MCTYEYPITAVCERCRKLFWGLVSGRFCDNPRCHGYLHFIER